MKEILLSIWLLSSMAEAKLIGSTEQKKEFAKDAIAAVIEAYDSSQKYKLDESSIELDKCNEYGSYVNEPWMADPYDCRIVYFYVRDKEGGIYSGKMMIDSELKKRFRLGIVPVKSKLPELSLTTREYTDEISKQQIYMGLSSMSQKAPEKQSLEELMSLEQTKPASTGGHVKAQLTPVRGRKAKN